jgi:hypothetical protein
MGSCLWICGWMVGTGLIAFILLYIALLHDPNRGQLRCPKCWYFMTGSTSLTCPECGYAAKHHKDFRKGRRNWRMAGVAVIVVFAGVCGGLWPAISRGDHWRYLETSTLIWFASIPAIMPSDSEQKLYHEIWQRHLTEEEYALLATLVADNYNNSTNLSTTTLLERAFHTCRRTPEGKVIFHGERVDFDPTNIADDPTAMLKRDLAIRMLDGLVVQWRLTSSREGATWLRRIARLGCANVFARQTMLERLFHEPTEWPLYSVYPTADDGNVMIAYMEALKTKDDLRQGRAAACLLYYQYLVGTLIPLRADQAWIKEQYPAARVLRQKAQPVCDDLIAETADSSPDERETAVKLILHWRGVFAEAGPLMRQRASTFGSDLASHVEEVFDLP